MKSRPPQRRGYVSSSDESESDDSSGSGSQKGPHIDLRHLPSSSDRESQHRRKKSRTELSYNKSSPESTQKEDSSRLSDLDSSVDQSNKTSKHNCIAFIMHNILW